MRFDIAKYAKTLSVLLYLCSLPVQGQDIDVEQPEGGAVFSTRTSSSISLSFSATNLKYGKETANNLEFFTLDIPGFQHTRDAGLPKLPVYTSVLDITGEEVVSIRISGVRTRRVFPGEKGIGGRLYPSQQPATKNQDPQDLPFTINEEFYSNNTPRQIDTVSLNYLGTVRGQELAQLVINPVIYYPAGNYFDLITYMDVAIETSSNSSSTLKVTNTVFSPKGVSTKGIGDYNQDDITPVFSLSPSGLIIVSDTLMKPFLKPLVEWKTRKGFNVIELYIGENGLERTYTSIKDTLDKIWALSDDEHPQADFIILAGDLSIIPESEGASDLSDMYYSEFDGGGDFLPDMYSGRLPASDTTEMKSIVAKILQYEMFSFADSIDYFKNSMLLAGYDQASVQYMDGHLNYANSNYLNTENNINNHLFLHQSDPALRTQQYDSAQSLFDTGIGFVNYTGHGSPSEWLSTGINYNFPAGLSNKGLYPVIISNACQTARFSSSTNMATEFVTAKNKGALAFIGCTVNTYWNEDFWWAVGLSSISAFPEYLSSGLGFYDRLFHTNNEQASDWFTSLGQIIHAGNMAVLASTSNYKKIYWEYYHLLGDPSIIPIMGPPTEFNIEIPDSIPRALKGLSISSEPFSYAAISHFDTLWDATAIDLSGNAYLQIPDLPEKDSCLIVITGQNKKPFIKTVYFNEPDTAWLSFINIIPSDRNSNNNNIAEYGENLQLDISIQNAGKQSATDTYIKLSSDSPYLNIASPDIVSIGDIAALSDIDITDKFNIEISDSIPDNIFAKLMLELYYGQNVVKEAFDIKLRAPDLSIVSFKVEDNLSGNGNMRPEPGENIDITLDIVNYGGSPISGILELLNISPYLVIGEASHISGSLIPGDTVSISFTGSLEINTPDGFNISFSSLLYCYPYSAEANHSFICGGSIEDFESLNFTTFPWVNDLIFPWIITSTDSYNNIYSAMSGLEFPDDNQVSSLSIMLNIPEDDTLSFWYRVSSELYLPDTINYGDKFSFLINDSVMIMKAGEVPWTMAEFELSAGVYYLEWRYSKDPNTYEGYDRAWIDLIEFPALSFIQSDIYISKLVSPSEPTKDYGNEQIITRVKNIGRDTIYTLPLSYSINSSFPVNEVFVLEVFPGDSTDVTFLQTADLSNDGEYNIKVYRTYPDNYAFNDSISKNVISTYIFDIISNSGDFTVGPNPFNLSTTVISNIDLKTTKFTLLDSRGKKVWEYQRPFISRGDRVYINGTGLADGLYILKIDTDIGSYVYKLINN